MFCLFFCRALLASPSVANMVSARDSRSIVEELNIAVLHVLLVLLQSSLGVALRGKHGVRLPARPSIVVVVDHHVDGIRHRAEPLCYILLGHPEGETPHVHYMPAAISSSSSSHATHGPTISSLGSPIASIVWSMSAPHATSSIATGASVTTTATTHGSRPSHGPSLRRSISHHHALSSLSLLHARSEHLNVPPSHACLIPV